MFIYLLYLYYKIKIKIIKKWKGDIAKVFSSKIKTKNEDNLRFELIQNGYSLFPYLKIKVDEAKRADNFKLTDFIIGLVKDHIEHNKGNKVISPISDRCYKYLKDLLKKEGLI